ncbi:superfamily II DNA/RNA helicase [Bacillus mesophilus]|uniref:DEAD/DEAH box helicase n=1 Tax=Bacillus mesophilus TaxID=1808955 RepID=A0A6M0QE50_9BACI|nr:DEAD/DEAH box helicase [Bacillus mesophilus]MBM7663241.1 superfamily II DNA/RNA helicase [Bacillus mesophilus]NEY73920.1 DEAD/DEAH box helicase [Bacillus mesophilus]
METSINQFRSFLSNAWSKAGFSEFTSVQAKAIPTMLEKKDMMVESPPGTGKTLAYLLPIFQLLIEGGKNPQAVIIAPTKELAMQIHEEAQKFLKDSEFSSASFIGGADLKRQLEKLKKHPQIIIGTPHRLVELIELRKLKMHEVKTIVLDEADQLIGSGSTKEIDRIIQSTMKDRQVVAFSATIPQSTIDQLEKRMNQPEKLTVETSLELKEKIKHLYIVCERREKIDYLRKLLYTEPDMKAIAFINDSFHLEALAEKMKYKKISAGILYSQSTQAEREATIKKFRLGKYQLLLATDVAARGLDIEAITHVIHLDLPEAIEQFVHRSGRTGRMGATGTVVSIVTPGEEQGLLQFNRRLNLGLEKVTLYRGQLTDEKPTYQERKKTPAPQSRPKKKVAHKKNK